MIRKDLRKRHLQVASEALLLELSSLSLSSETRALLELLLQRKLVQLLRIHDEWCEATMMTNAAVLATTTKNATTVDESGPQQQVPYRNRWKSSENHNDLHGEQGYSLPCKVGTNRKGREKGKQDDQPEEEEEEDDDIWFMFNIARCHAARLLMLQGLPRGISRGYTCEDHEDDDDPNHTKPVETMQHSRSSTMITPVAIITPTTPNAIKSTNHIATPAGTTTGTTATSDYQAKLNQKLMHECCFGNLQAVQKLLTPPLLHSHHGRVPTIADIHATDSFGRTCVFWTIINGHYPMLQWLTQAGARLDVTDKWGRSPLHLEGALRSLPIAQFLVKANPLLLLEAKDNGDRSPLLRACQLGCWEVVNYFVAQPGVHVNCTSSANGLTPLHYVCRSDTTYMIHTVTCMLQQGANIHAKENLNGQTPLHFLAASGNDRSDVATLLIQAGADVSVEDCSGSTPISLARETHSSSLVSTLLIMEEEKFVQCQKQENPPSVLNSSHYSKHCSKSVGKADRDDRSIQSDCTSPIWAVAEPVSMMDDNHDANHKVPPPGGRGQNTRESFPAATKTFTVNQYLEWKRLKVIELQMAVEVARHLNPIINSYDENNPHWSRVIRLQEECAQLDEFLRRSHN